MLEEGENKAIKYHIDWQMLFSCPCR